MSHQTSLRKRASDLRWKWYWTRRAPAIFIHINKTAGTSIIDALGQPHVRHLPASDVKALVGTEVWNRKFTFSIVRNPYTRAISHYRYRCKHSIAGLSPDTSTDFTSWFRAAYVDQDPRYMDNPRMFMPQYRWISDDKRQVLVDEIGCFENLAESWCWIGKRLSLDFELQHKNQTSSGQRAAAELSTETAALIAQVMADDFVHFGYSIDPSQRFDNPAIASSLGTR